MWQGRSDPSAGPGPTSCRTVQRGCFAQLRQAPCAGGQLQPVQGFVRRIDYQNPSLRETGMQAGRQPSAAGLTASQPDEAVPAASNRSRTHIQIRALLVEVGEDHAGDETATTPTTVSRGWCPSFGPALLVSCLIISRSSSSMTVPGLEGVLRSPAPPVPGLLPLGYDAQILCRASRPRRRSVWLAKYPDVCDGCAAT